MITIWQQRKIPKQYFIFNFRRQGISSLNLMVNKEINIKCYHLLKRHSKDILMCCLPKLMHLLYYIVKISIAERTPERPKTAFNEVLKHIKAYLASSFSVMSLCWGGSFHSEKEWFIIVLCILAAQKYVNAKLLHSCMILICCDNSINSLKKAFYLILTSGWKNLVPFHHKNMSEVSF